MTDIFRELETKQKSITLYKDQGEELYNLLKKNPRAFQQFIRRSVDLGLAELKQKESN